MSSMSSLVATASREDPSRPKASSFLKRMLVALLALASVSCASRGSALAPPAPETGVSALGPVEDLPRLLVVYSYSAVQRPSFAPLFEADPQNPVRRALVDLDQAFAAQRGDLATRMAFTKGAYILPIGASVEVPGDPPESMLFVVPLQRGRALLVLSSNSPRRTSIAIVDPSLQIHLLYDAFERNRDSAGRQLALGALSRITVLAEDRLRLEDLAEPGASRRTLELSLEPEGVRFASENP